MSGKTRGKLIVIEGPDGCGKQTQAAKLFDRLQGEGRQVRQITFPDYGSDSSALVKMYLKGDFGGEACEVNPYAAATFYAVDRWASFTVAWGKWHQAGGMVVADRYVTSNMAHQAVKITDPAGRENFWEWLWDLEFVKFGLPVPDVVIFLDLPPQASLELISQREASARVLARDIHEKNAAYLAAVYQSYLLASQKYGWEKINCAAPAGIRTVEDIHEEIYRTIINKI